MNFKQLYVVEESDEVLTISTDCRGNTCPAVTRGLRLVWNPILWKRGAQYRLFSSQLLSAVYELSVPNQSLVIIIRWGHGVPVSTTIGGIIFGE